MASEAALSLVSLERGRLTFAVRPRVQDLPGIQRFLLLLAPDGGRTVRRIAIGKRRLPRKTLQEREWAYIDRVLPRSGDALADLGAHVYSTKTRGIRHQPAAYPIAEGTYELLAHGQHTHLTYKLDDVEARDVLLSALAIRPRGDLIVAVFNPLRWQGPAMVGNDNADDDLPISEPSIFDDELQAKFGDRRFAALEPAHLDVEGAELVLIDAGGEPLAVGY